MANATAILGKGAVPHGKYEHGQKSSATLASATRYYTGAMIGLTTGGYLAKFDDTQSLIFMGLVRGDEGNPNLPAGTAGDGTINLDYDRPDAFEVALTGVAVTDIGKTVYATFDQTATMDNATTIYANVIGVVIGVAGTDIALVEPAYDGVAGNKRLMATRTMAATGTQTISKWDVGKTISVPNSAALTLNLPAAATVPIGQTLKFVKSHLTDANAITLDGNASENIDGATTLATMDAPFDACELTCFGTLWIVTVTNDAIT